MAVPICCAEESERERSRVGRMCLRAILGGCESFSSLWGLGVLVGGGGEVEANSGTNRRQTTNGV